MSFLARRTYLALKSNEARIKQCLNYCTGILDGVNVLDMSRIIAGPFCSMMLGDLGANVLKVESLEGDEARKWGPPFINGSQDSFYFLSVNRNKKSICINLKTDEGKAILYDIAKRSDVMVENFVPGKLEALGVGYRQLSALNPRLVYCAVTGYGSVGPYAHRPGYDVIASAVGGLMNATGDKGGAPVKVGVAITDVTTGLHAFGAIMAALYRRQSSGRGQKIDCDLLSTQISSMINIASVYLNTGLEPERWGTEHPNIVPYQGFKTTDGYLVLGAGSNAQFTALCALVDKKELASDDRFKTNSGRVENREELVRILSEMFESKTTKEWSNIFKDAPFPNGPLNIMKDVFEDEHVKAIGLVKELAHPDAGSVKLVGPPTVYGEGGNEARTAPPTLGQHTRDILTSFLLYSEEKVDRLFHDHIEGPAPERVAVITLRPAAATLSKKKVVWTDDTVDNEDMNKKKSKCCCIYEKRRKFDDSDSDDSEDECEHCFGHVERRHMRGHLQAHRDAADGAASTLTQESPAVQTEPTTTVVLQPPPEPSPPPPSPPPAIGQ